MKLPGLSKSATVFRGARGSMPRPGLGGLLKGFDDFGVLGLLANAFLTSLPSGDE